MGKESFETGTGLDPEVTVKINDGIWNYDDRIADGEVPLLKLFGINTETGGEWNQWFKSDRSWKIVDDGKRVDWVGRAKKPVFNKATAYADFLNSFVECNGADEAIAAREMDAWAAEAWVGLTLRLEREDVEFNIKGEHIVTERLFVREIVDAGVEAGAAVTAPATAKKAEKATQGVSEELQAILEAIAKSAGTFEEFIDAAFAVDGVIGGNAEKSVIDDSPTGFYLTHH